MTVGQGEWFFLGLVFLWFAISAVLSLASGWHALARRFRSDEPVEGERVRCRATAMGWRGLPMSYGRCVYTTVGQRALALSVIAPFRLLHPPLVIPWAEVERCERVALWFRKCVSVHVRGHGRGLTFHESVGEPMLEAWTRANEARMGAA